ncbi:hypothetical protein EGH24_09185 [Halonotius terrestris]|uniref:Uncharacterized protein n=2 Tax=Halonotius terrestris TaxID=2487750 RepID=A0A8J8PC36_9EURY|nr:hypothetical protein EGH24_09185 [Halonotius terrestris]
MIGTMLREIRAHIDALARESGEFYLVCSRYGEQPVPAAGLRFPTRSTAREAARATTQYRQTLRRYDPQLPHYDIVVCQDTEATADATHETTDPPDSLSIDTAGDAPAAEQRALVTFCHRVAAAVFETLAAGEYDDIEAAVMDAYFEHAESESSPNELCLRLLESMATVLATRLSVGEQAELLAEAADRLDDTSVAGETTSDVADDTAATDSGVDGVFDALQAQGVIDAYRQSPWLLDRRTGSRSLMVHVSAYAFSPHEGQLPTLPIVVALYGSETDWRPAAVEVRDADADSWRLRIAPIGEAAPDGLVSAPIKPGQR